jgi:hypothetical protein
MNSEDLRRSKSAAAKTKKRKTERKVPVIFKGMCIAVENTSFTCEVETPDGLTEAQSGKGRERTMLQTSSKIPEGSGGEPFRFD